MKKCLSDSKNFNKKNKKLRKKKEIPLTSDFGIKKNV